MTDLLAGLKAAQAGTLGRSGVSHLPPPNVPKPLGEAMEKVGNVLEVPNAVIGAAQMDYLRRRQAGMGPAEALRQTLLQGYFPNANKNTSEEHALGLINKGKLGEAADLYSTTSLLANKQRAGLGDRPAQFFQHHPSIFSFAAVPAEEVANPANATVGSLTGMAGEAIRKPPVAMTGARFQDVRNAAEDAPGQRATAASAKAEREAAAGAARHEAAEKAAQARRDAHFATKQAQSAAPQPVRMNPRDLGHPLPGSATAKMLNPSYATGEAPIAGLDRPLPQPLPPGTSPAALQSARLLPEPPMAGPALVGEQRLALPPPPAAEAQTLPGMAERGIPKRYRVRSGRKPIVSGPLSPVQPVGARPALPPSPLEAGPSVAQGEGFGMNEPPRPPAQAALPAPPPATPEQNLQKALLGKPPSQLGPGVEGAPGSPGAGPLATGAEPRPGPIVPGEVTHEGAAAPKQAPPHYESMMPKEVADEAERAFLMAANNSGERALANRVTNAFGKGLTRQEQIDLADALESRGSIPVNPKFAKNAAEYQREQRLMSQNLLLSEIASPEELVNAERFVPRYGAYADEEMNAAEDAAKPSRMTTVGRGTVGKQRVYDTRLEAELSGEQMNPNHEPTRAIWRHTFKNAQRIKLQELVQKLGDLGLILPAGEPVPPGWTTMKDEPGIREFNSPTLNSGASMHPAVAKGIRDITVHEMNPDSLLSTAAGQLTKPLDWANRAAASFQTMFAPYHTVVNVGPQQLATIAATTGIKAPLALARYAKELATFKGLGEAREAGVAPPFASDVPAYETTRPLSDLSPMEKVKRAGNMGKKGLEAVTSRPLYQGAQPHMGKAMYKALVKSGVPEPEAALRTMQSMGEHENLSAVERRLGKAFVYPSWRKSTFRLWPQLFGKMPALYQGPHRGAKAYNQSRGVSDLPLASSRFFPEITGPWPGPFSKLPSKDAHGNPYWLNLPSPADFPLRAAELAGEVGEGDLKKAGDTAVRTGLSLLNPLLSTGARAGATVIGNAGDPGTGLGGYRLWDKDAPQPGPAAALAQILGTSAERYAPVKPGATGPLEAIGIGARAEYPEATYQNRAETEAVLRSQVRAYRYQAADLLKAGDTEGAAAATKQADQYYAYMQKYLNEAFPISNPP